MSTNVKFFLGIQLVIWAALAIITRASWIGFEASPPSWSKLITYSAMGFLYSTTLAGIFVRMYGWPIVRQVLAAFAITVGMALFWRITYNAVEYHIIEAGEHEFLFWGYLHWGRTSATQMLLWAGVYWALHYYASYREQKLQAAAAKAQAQNAKLRLLQYQVNPHFLFNALGSLDTLLLKDDVPNARLMLEKLSDFMRQTLEREPTPAVSLGVEIERIEGYLDIVKIRVGDRLNVRWHLPDPLPKAELPNGILLPLVENAVKHGAVNSRGGGYISTHISASDDRLIIRIENDMKTGNEPGFGIGQANTRERLETFYHGKASMTAAGNGEVYKVELELPIDQGNQP